MLGLPASFDENHRKHEQRSLAANVEQSPGRFCKLKSDSARTRSRVDSGAAPICVEHKMVFPVPQCVEEVVEEKVFESTLQCPLVSSQEHVFDCHAAQS